MNTSSFYTNDEKESVLDEFAVIAAAALSITKSAKQLGNKQQSIQSQLQSIDILEKTCGKLLGALQALKVSLTSCNSCSIQARPAISLLTV